MDLKKGRIGIVVLVMFGLIVSFSLLAQASPHAVEIQVEGTPGLSFSGSYGDAGSQKTVDGTVPETYTIEELEGGIVSAVFQKRGREGELMVKIVKDGRVVQSESTTAEYGVVAISYSKGTPGFELAIAIAGILTMAYLLRRRGK